MRFLKLLVCAVLCAALLAGCASPASDASSKPDFTQVPEGWSDVKPAEYRAMWISYLEWPLLDTSSADAFTASAVSYTHLTLPTT